MRASGEVERRAAIRAARVERDRQIAARVQAGEKRYMLAIEYHLDPHTIGEIAKRAGLPPRSRFKRQNQKDETWHADSKSSNHTQTSAPCSTAG